jgi:murein DD-endopeptidase MepM/ murein hydrolase activator NlpD
MPGKDGATAMRIAAWVYSLAQRGLDLHSAHRMNLPLLTRYTAHLGIIALTIIALLFTGVEIRSVGSNSRPSEGVGQALPPILCQDQSNPDNLTLAVVPLTIAPARVRREVEQYQVQSGDTVTGIAVRFNVSADSILWANAKLEDNPDMLSLGQSLDIPPTSGVLYTVSKGDTLAAIAARFKANIENILNDPFDQTNHDLKANPPQLTVGAFLMIPGGSKPFTTRRVTYTSTAPSGAARGTSNFIWPVPGACVSQIFWSRHSGIDLAAPTGSPILAADSGYVQIVGWDSTGYGNMILLNHGNGFLTRYGHLSAFNVEAGQSVRRGDLIGRVGTTGHSTGPHLHFEVIFQGVPRNPAYFVAGRSPSRCPGY